MTGNRLPLAELMQKAGGDDFLRSVAEAVVRLLMEADADGLIGAGRHASGPPIAMAIATGRWTHAWAACSFASPSCGRAATVRPFWSRARPRGRPWWPSSRKPGANPSGFAGIGGVSTRRADDLVRAMGLSGIGKSTVSKLCKDVDNRVHAFLHRPLSGDWPHLWLDAT